VRLGEGIVGNKVFFLRDEFRQNLTRKINFILYKGFSMEKNGPNSPYYFKGKNS